MSVRVTDREESRLEYFHNALKLRKEVTELLLRDFGINKKFYDTIDMARWW